MKIKVIPIITVLFFIAFPCLAEWDFGLNTYLNILYADRPFVGYEPGHLVYPGCNGVKLFAKYVHPFDGFELESEIDAGFTGYGPGISIYGGFGKELFISDSVIYRISGDFSVGASSFAGGFNIGLREMNEFKFMFNESFGLGLQFGILYMNYIFNTTDNNFLDCPWGIEAVFK